MIVLLDLNDSMFDCLEICKQVALCCSWADNVEEVFLVLIRAKPFPVSSSMIQGFTGGSRSKYSCQRWSSSHGSCKANLLKMLVQSRTFVELSQLFISGCCFNCRAAGFLGMLDRTILQATWVFHLSFCSSWWLKYMSISVVKNYFYSPDLLLKNTATQLSLHILSYTEFLITSAYYAYCIVVWHL